MSEQRLLILSDGKPGHLNQSIAFAKHKGYQFDICAVAFKSRFAKGFSYLADHCHLYLDWLFETEEITGNYQAIVSTGSETYYANRVLAKKLGIKSIAIMLPQSYRYDFDLIIAQQHDDPPARKNVLSLPINLTYGDPEGLVVPEPEHKYVAVIVGGDSKLGPLEPEHLREQLKMVFKLFPGYDFWLTTSRRTSLAVETVLREFSWSRAVYYSQEKINPIPDFLQHTEYAFLTPDSTSMISEAVSSGEASVELFSGLSTPLEKSKFARMIDLLLEMNAVHLFDGQVGAAKEKIDLTRLLKEVFV